MPSHHLLSAKSQAVLDAHDVLVVPGLGGSGETHWQTFWERAFPAWRRVEQDDWSHPDRDLWVDRLGHAVAAARRPVLLVAHSLGCATIAHAASQGRLARVAGAFLVAMPDIERADFPVDLCLGFSPLPRSPLPFPSVMVGSTNDPWITLARLQGFAESFGSRFVDAGERHHIGTASGLGSWDEGLSHLDRFLASFVR